MPITLTHFAKEVCKFTITASADIEPEKDKSYKLSLQIVNSQNKNPLSFRDALLEGGKGTIEETFNYSPYMEDGISINVTACLTKLPSPEPIPEADSRSGAETVPGNAGEEIMESTHQNYRLFGLYDCLDYLDFHQGLSYRRQTASLTLQPLNAFASIFLKKDYRLLSIADHSVSLTYSSTASKPVTPQWDIHLIDNLIFFQTALPDSSLLRGFSEFRFEAAALILHQPSNLILMLPFVLDSKVTQ